MKFKGDKTFQVNSKNIMMTMKRKCNRKVIIKIIKNNKSNKLLFNIYFNKMKYV